MVQEQWLQLKMKFLLGFNMEIIALWGKYNFGGGCKSTGGSIEKTLGYGLLDKIVAHAVKRAKNNWHCQ